MLFPIHTIWYSLKIPRFDLYCLSERKKSSYETLQLRLIDSVNYILNLPLSPTGRTSKYQVTISQNFDNFFALNESYCRSRLKNDVYMHIWLVFCGSIPQLIFPLALRTRVTCVLWRKLFVVALSLGWYFLSLWTRHIVAHTLKMRYKCVSGLFVLAVPLNWYFLSL